MEIAVFENEIRVVEGAFEAFNIIYFNDNISITYYKSSQEAKPYEDLYKYKVIIVDIELTLHSELDGFNLIKAILPHVDKNKIVIMTGFSKTGERLKELGLPLFPIITKPLTFDSLNDTLSPLLKS